MLKKAMLWLSSALGFNRAIQPPPQRIKLHKTAKSITSAKTRYLMPVSKSSFKQNQRKQRKAAWRKKNKR